MTNDHIHGPERAGTQHYEIRVAGLLDPRWASRFEGLTPRHQSDGTTLLAGPITDQAALHGLLQRVRDLGIALLSVTRIDPDPRD